MKKLILLLWWVAPVALWGNSENFSDQVVSIDAVEVPNGKVEFVTEWKDLRPELSDFKIVHRNFLSNGLGERFALVTFTRSKGGVRSLKLDYVVGVLANGERLHPVRIEGESQLGERGSLLLHFGQHKFPLVSVETRRE